MVQKYNMQIINPGKEDYHIHSTTFSDGFNSIDEIVKTAGKIKLKTIAITDHCQAHLDHYNYFKQTCRAIIQRWKNQHNNVKVIFGIEADIINEQGDISKDIQGIESDFTLLSTHSSVYSSDPKKITQAYLNAITKHKKSIKFLSHPCSIYFKKHLDIKKIVSFANNHNIPMEFNCANLVYNKTNLTNLKIMLKKCDQIYINSDSHTLNELQTLRQKGFEYLKKKGYRIPKQI